MEEWEMEQVDSNAGGEYDASLYAYKGIVPTLEGPIGRLDARTRHQFAEDGYLAIQHAFPIDVVREGIGGVDKLISGSVQSFHGIQWEAAARDRLETMDLEARRDAVRKLIFFVSFDDRLRRISEDPGLLAAVESLIGEKPVLFADQALLKPPGIGREKPWHQDKAFFDVRPGAPVVGVWIALDRTTPENGCMHVIPGSHRDGPVVHFTRRDFQICDADVRTKEILAVPLEPGGCLIFDSLLHHGTPANSSLLRRWALQFHYAPSSAIWKSEEERAVYREKRLAVFGAEGKDVTC